MIATAIGSVLATLSVCFGIAGGVAFFVLHKKPAEEAPKEPIEEEARSLQMGYLEVIASRVAELEVIVRGLPSLWEEERERSKKHADRAAQAYRSAEQVLDTITGGDAAEDESDGIPELDEERGGLMQPLLFDVGGAAQRAEDEAEVRERARRHILSMG